MKYNQKALFNCYILNNKLINILLRRLFCESTVILNTKRVSFSIIYYSSILFLLYSFPPLFFRRGGIQLKKIICCIVVISSHERPKLRKLIFFSFLNYVFCFSHRILELYSFYSILTIKYTVHHCGAKAGHCLVSGGSRFDSLLGGSAITQHHKES